MCALRHFDGVVISRKVLFDVVRVIPYGAPCQTLGLASTRFPASLPTNQLDQESRLAKVTEVRPCACTYLPPRL